jgi:hypothetical protein
MPRNKREVKDITAKRLLSELANCNAYIFLFSGYGVIGCSYVVKQNECSLRSNRFLLRNDIFLDKEKEKPSKKKKKVEAHYSGSSEKVNVSTPVFSIFFNLNFPKSEICYTVFIFLRKKIFRIVYHNSINTICVDHKEFS